MKAIVYTEYGPPEVLRIKEVEKPTPKDNEVLIKVYATTVTPADYRLRSFKFPPRLMAFWLPMRLLVGIFGPRKQILGEELAGVVEAVGKDVKKFSVGDQVFSAPDAQMGAYAEYKCMPEDGALEIKPANMTFEEAAAVPFGASDALYYLRDLGNIQKGQSVLIYGASGGVGTAAVQLAKYFGAEVTAVCSATNMEMVKSLGADRVIDYTREDFTINEETYDIIFDVVGKITFSQCKESLSENGVFLANVMGLTDILLILWTSITGGKKIKGGVGMAKPENMPFFKELIEAEKLKTVIDKVYPFDQCVEAHRYADTGRKRGNVVITLEHGDKPDMKSH